MALSPEKDEILPVIDLARTLAIFLVVQMHLILSTLVRPPSNPLILQFWLALARNGVYGVFLFFVVSGFLITRLLDRMPGGLFGASPRRFYVRRLGRIVPLFLLSIAIGLAIYSLAPLNQKGWIVGFAMPNAFNTLFWLSVFTFTFNWLGALGEGLFFGTGFHWDLLWSLSIEEQFYLFYPWILKSLKNTKRLTLVLITVCLVGPGFRAYAAYAYPERRLLGYMSTPGIFDCIAWGSILYLVWLKWGTYLRINPSKSWRLVVGGMVVLTSVYLGTSMDRPWNLVWAPTCLSFGLCLFLLGGLALPFFQGPLIRILAIPGKLSYGIYLLHMIVLYILSPILQERGIGLDLSLFMASLILVAWISNRFFEKPVNQWIRKWEVGKG